MPNAKSTPLDLAAFDDLDTPIPEPVERGTASLPVPASLSALELETEPERLVDVSNLRAEELSAGASADKIDFRNTNSLLAHGEGALADIAQSSRQLLTGVRLGDAGEVGRIAAGVIDGVKICASRICRPRRTARRRRPAKVHRPADRVRRRRAYRVQGLYREPQEISGPDGRGAGQGAQNQGRSGGCDRAAGPAGRGDPRQPAHAEDRHRRRPDRAGSRHQELEALRQNAVQTGDPADAADVMEFRSALANFRGKIAEMRENLVGSAMLIPIIGQNKKAAETRLMKISNGMLVVIPRLMAVASQAVVQVDIRRAAEEARSWTKPRARSPCWRKGRT